MNDCVELLRSSSGRFRRLILLIDALDEHSFSDGTEDEIQISLLDQLLTLQASRKNISLFVTSREFPMVQKRLAESVRLDIHATGSDIRSYVEARIHDHAQFRFAGEVGKKPELANTIIDAVVTNADGM